MIRLATQAFRFLARPLVVQPFGLAKLFRAPRIPGQASTRTKNASSSWKKRVKTKNRKYKIGHHNGLLKRVKIVGPRRERRIKFKSPGARHLNRNKSRANLMRKRLTRYISDVDMPRMRKLIPLLKRRKQKRLQ